MSLWISGIYECEFIGYQPLFHVLMELLIGVGVILGGCSPHRTVVPPYSCG